MDLREIGEFGFIDHLKPLFKDLNDSKVYGIGDDCAIIPANEELEIARQCKCLLEGNKE